MIKSLKLERDLDLVKLRLIILLFIGTNLYLAPTKSSVPINTLAHNPIIDINAFSPFNSQELVNSETTINALKSETSLKYSLYTFFGVFIFILITIASTTSYLYIRSKREYYRLRLYNNELQSKLGKLDFQVSHLTNQVQESKNLNLRLRRYASVLTHDIKEPARTLYSYASLLHKKISPEISKTEAQYIEVIKSSGKRLHDMINTLYRYSHDNILILNDFKLISLQDIIKVVIDQLSKTIQISETQIVTNQLSDIEVWGNESLITQLLQNLINNSIKYRRPTVKCIIEISTEIIDDNHILVIKDNGKGISDDKIGKIVELLRKDSRYEQIKNMGLGLTICKEIMDLHNGRIWLDSVEHKSTKVYLDFSDAEDVYI